jgi:hypothetical protein
MGKHTDRRGHRHETINIFVYNNKEGQLMNLYAHGAIELKARNNSKN